MGEKEVWQEQLFDRSGRCDQSVLLITHQFRSELFLARMALLKVQRHSALPLRSAKAREFEENVRAYLGLSNFKLDRTSFSTGSKRERPKTVAFISINFEGGTKNR